MNAAGARPSPLEVLDTILYLAERGLQVMDLHSRRRRPLTRKPGQTVEETICRRAAKLLAALARQHPDNLDDLRRGETLF